MDLSSSRLVFVSVKNAQPKRKVAIPVPDTGSWETFISVICSKLKLSGVETLELAATGEQIVRLAQLQDIDEVFATPASRDGPSGTGLPGTAGGAAGLTSPSARSSADPLAGARTPPPGGQDGEEKYAKRQSSLQRTLRRAFPSLFGGGTLPVTHRDASTPAGGAGAALAGAVGNARRRIRRRRRGCLDARSLALCFALIIFFGTAIYVYSRTWTGLP